MNEKMPSHLAVLNNRNLVIMIGALLVILLGATFIFGAYSLLIAGVAIVFSGCVELIFAKTRKKGLDYSILITPLIFALTMPPSVPLWVVAIGASFGTFFAKSLFGGLGKNIFNPAMVGYIFVTISFPRYLNTQWLNPKTDVIGSVTPLIGLNGGNLSESYMDLLLGVVPGSLGETFRIGILIIGLLLVVLKIVDWRIPVSILGTVFIVNLIGNQLNETYFSDPVASLLVGSVLFGSFFVASDPVSMPVSNWAKVIYGIGIAAIILIIRGNPGAYPAGMAFSVVIMNAFSPLIDSYFIKEAGELV
ncbi:Na+-transporting ubiquinone oxidoreductase subunit B [Paracholeplasma brassicae]|uniref:Na+-transporting ubiquinone oxidoreductase subunit B n=1 Tax=Acholeplasma brassicae TaxID=61635 RepID=U4KMD4_9MOLU|nr:RnfABCDGE type electron transport complex subunit D [Paracholeplasma brassicae]CCV65240.1 Na+-transporting ubiquinone oxidoreductase subunit B [Paracholeplasma brassicae]